MNLPDPVMLREANIRDLCELGFPPPDPSLGLVWDSGDTVAMRSRLEIEQRIAALHALLTAVFGAPREMTLGWCERNGLVEALTPVEYAYLTTREGNHDELALHLEAEWALAWMLGIADELDPIQYASDELAAWAPDLVHNENFEQWRLRSPVQTRPADEVAAILDLYYCADAAMIAVMQGKQQLSGAAAPMQPYVIGQRLWALEWAVLFTGEDHTDEPLAWDDVM